MLRCLIMQAVIRGTFGISELQRRKASPVHICWASALNAKLDVERAEKDTAKAAMRPALRMVLMRRAVMIGPR